MASVSTNYSEVFIDSGNVMANTPSEHVIYSEVQRMGESAAFSSSSTSANASTKTTASSQQHLQQDEDFAVSSSHQLQQHQRSEGFAVATESSQQLQSEGFAITAATESSQQQQSEGLAITAATESSQQLQSEGFAIAESSTAASIQQREAVASTSSSSRMVGFGYQNFAFDKAAESNTQRQSETTKESRFGQFRRSFSKGKRSRIPTGSATNFANGNDVIMKGWLHKQASRGFHLWKRRWFVLRGKELFYYKSPKDNGALGCVKLHTDQRIAPTDENLSKKYSFKIEQKGQRTYFIAADSKELLTNWMNAISLAALGIAPDLIQQQLAQLKPSGAVEGGIRSQSTSDDQTTSKTISGGGRSASSSSSVVHGLQVSRVQPAASQVRSTSAFHESAPDTAVAIHSGTRGNSTVVATEAASSSVEARATGQTVTNTALGGVVNVAIVNGGTSLNGEETRVKEVDMEESESDSDSSDGSDSESGDNSDEESYVSSEMEQTYLVGKAPPVANPTINKTENITRNENVTINKTVNQNYTEDEGLKSFFGSGHHITGTEVKSAETLTKPIAVKPPTYNQVSPEAAPPSVSSLQSATHASSRAGQVYGNLTDWQNRTLQRPPQSNRNRIASAGDPYATERRPVDSNGRAQSAERELDDAPGVFQRTQSMRSLKMWYEHQKTAGKSRGGTPDPDCSDPYQQQQPVIMDLDKNDRLYVNPSTATLVRSKSRQAGQTTLTKSSGALVPARPSTAMGNYAVATLSRDQIMMQKNYQMQQYLRQQYLAQQQQQQQQQALIMQQQMQQQQALLLQQQIQREQELMRKKKEKEKKEREKKLKLKKEQERREQQIIEDQLKRSTTIINESVVHTGDPKVKRVFVRRAKKEPKPAPLLPLPVERKEFGSQTITEIGIQTEMIVVEPPPPPPTCVSTLIIQNPAPTPPVLQFASHVVVSPPTPEESSSEEEEEEWEILVSSDQNSWNIVAKESLPARVIRSASLSNLEFFVKEQLSEETQKVLDEAEEVRFSEEVIHQILTKTVEDTTTTSTQKTVSMISENNNYVENVSDGSFIIEDVGNAEEMALRAISSGASASSSSSTALISEDSSNANETSRTTVVTNISSEPYQDSQVSSYTTEEGDEKVSTTSFHRGNATIVDDQVAYNYASSDSVVADFQRQVQQMQTEFGDAGDVVSDSGMSYQTPAGVNVNVEQRIATAKTGVKVTLDGSSVNGGVDDDQYHGQLQNPTENISIMDMETNQILPPAEASQSPSFTQAFDEFGGIKASSGDLGVVDASMHDFRIATMQRRVSTYPDKEKSPTPEREEAHSHKAVKGILKKRPTSISSDVDVDVSATTASQFTEQSMDTVHRMSDGRWEDGTEKISTASTTTVKTTPTTKSSSIVVHANSPATERKVLTSETAAVDISLASPSTKHFSTHVHRTLASPSPTFTVEVDTSTVYESQPTTILTTTLDHDQHSSENLGNQYGSSITTDTATLHQKANSLADGYDQISFVGSQGSSSVLSSSQVVQGSSSVVSSSSSITSSSQVVQRSGPALSSVQFLLTEDRDGDNRQQHHSESSSSARMIKTSDDLVASAGCVGGNVGTPGFPPLEIDIEKMREKVVNSVLPLRRSESTESASSLGRKLIALRRETEAKETTLTYFERRLKQEEETWDIVRKSQAGGGSSGIGATYVQGQEQTQATNVAKLREKVHDIRQSIGEGKLKISSLETEWNQVKPAGFEDTDILASLSAASSRSDVRGGSVSTENLSAISGSSSGNVALAGASSSNDVAATSTSRSGGGGSTTVDSMESKAVAVEKEAMRSVLSTITSQFTARNQDFDRLRREEEEIKALLASRMRGIDLEIDQIEKEHQRLEIQQVLGDLESGGGGAE